MGIIIILFGIAVLALSGFFFGHVLAVNPEQKYHVDFDGILSYGWYLEGEKTWHKLNKEPGVKFGAALISWNYESMDDKGYFFDPSVTEMLIGWQNIDGKWYCLIPENEKQIYFGSNSTK